MAKATVSCKQILSQFTPEDVAHMKSVTGGALDLSNCISVKAWASEIYAQVSTGQMPPGNPWSKEWVQNFATWMGEGSSCADCPS